jgi:arginine-tRNA-protein transferase
MPLRRPVEMTSADFDACLARGDRRLGTLLYNTQCPACQACEAIRIPVAEFQAHRSQRRTFIKGNTLLEVRVGPPECDETRVALFNRHKALRGLAQAGDGEIDLEGYCDFLVESCCQTLEFSYWHGAELVAVAISDRGEQAMNAVYCFFEPTFANVGLGTFNVLRQIEYCRAEQLKYLYLGYYIGQSPHMLYKGRYLPHERLLHKQWHRFDA